IKIQPLFELCKIKTGNSEDIYYKSVSGIRAFIICPLRKPPFPTEETVVPHRGNGRSLLRKRMSLLGWRKLSLLAVQKEGAKPPDFAPYNLFAPK
ncbi:MAG: hypothetical protein LUE99_08210, partial [Bacteroides sp.]|nr:hypothetical protein [Bacteroides sp.]